MNWNINDSAHSGEEHRGVDVESIFHFDDQAYLFLLIPSLSSQ